MAKALFFSLPLHGHTNPSLPLVQELVEQGEEVVYYSTPAFVTQVQQTGARYQPYRNAFLADIKHLPERIHELSWLLMRTTAELLSQEADALRAEKPDYIIADSVAPWGQWMGELFGIPVVTSVSTFAFNRHVMAFGIARRVRLTSGRIFLSKMQSIVKVILLRRQVRSRHKIRGTNLMGTLCGQSNLNIVYTSRYFQPCADTFDKRYQFVGPSLASRNENIRFPWEQVRHPVIVYISLGTLFNANAAFYQH